MVERVLDLEEVRTHCSRDDAWVVVDGGVYDVSDFVDRHPGGADLLLSHAGEDVSILLREDSPHRHSAAAYSVLESCRIGSLRHNNNHNGSVSNGCVRSSVNGGEGSYRRHLAKENPSQTTSLANGDCSASCDMKGWREEDLVDWRKPMLSQVGQLGTVYHKWVHSPVDKPLRLFHSDFVEFFSRTPWFVIPFVWLPVMVFLSTLSIWGVNEEQHHHYLFSATDPVCTSTFAIWFLGGIFGWTLIEYLLHRFLFHLTPPDNSPFLITCHFLLHGQHHKVPFEPYRLVFPPAAAALIFGVLYAIFTSFLPIGPGRALMSGGVLGYVCYDLTHYYLHHGAPSKGGYFHQLKTYHVRHHFVDHQAGFGISSKLWDIPFGTHQSRTR